MKDALTKKQINLDEIERKALEMDQVECPVIHRFSPGLYIRELHMPAGIFAIGHRQKYEHFNLFLKGRILTKGENGEVMDLKAPMTFTAPPGRKFGYIVEDVVWINVYPTTETDVETLEAMLLDKSEAWKEKNLEWFGREPARIEDIKDFQKVLEEFGFDEATARRQSENEDDMVPLPPGEYKFIISNSNIEGRGVFASAPMDPGEIIGPARIGDKRTVLGRYTNHAAAPNARMIQKGDIIYLVAIMPIKGCKAGFNGEEITTDYRQNLKLIGGRKCQQLQQQSS